MICLFFFSLFLSSSLPLFLFSSFLSPFLPHFLLLFFFFFEFRPDAYRLFHILDLSNCFFLIRIRSNILSQNLVSNIVYFSLYHIPRTKCEIVSLLVIQSLAPWLRTTRSLHSKASFVNTNLWGDFWNHVNILFPINVHLSFFFLASTDYACLKQLFYWGLENGNFLILCFF